MATYVIGDVHGCYQTLQDLLDKITFQINRDTLWFTGDLVNRGPRSLEVLQFVADLPDAICVLGNHDLFLLALWAGLTPSKEENNTLLDNLLNAPEADALMHWLKGQPLIHEGEKHLLVHAGIPPQWSLKQACDLSKEIENKLQSDHYIDFLMHIEGNTPHSWSDKSEHADHNRWRYIVNALTRMRFCTPEGQLNLTCKSPAHSPPEGFLPWYAHKQHQYFDENILKNNKKIIFGHWAALEGKAQHPHVIALDTGCVWGHCLTAIRLDDHQMFQAPFSD